MKVQEICLYQADSEDVIDEENSNIIQKKLLKTVKIWCGKLIKYAWNQYFLEWKEYKMRVYKFFYFFLNFLKFEKNDFFLMFFFKVFYCFIKI